MNQERTPARPGPSSIVHSCKLVQVFLLLAVMTACSFESVGEISSDPEQRQADLFQAAKWEGPRRTRALIEAGALADARDFNGWTPLHYAINRMQNEDYGDPRVIRALLESEGADINAMTNDGFTPISLAARHGAIGALDLLLERGVEISARADGGMTPLMIALDERQMEMVKHLLVRGADVNEQLSRGGGTLYIAIKNKSPEAVRLLIAHGASVGGSEKAAAPIIFAASLRDEEVVTLLLEAGADVNAVNQRNGMTALHRAIESGPSMIQLLLSAGANVNVLNRSAETPLSLAEKTGDPELIRLLSVGS